MQGSLHCTLTQANLQLSFISLHCRSADFDLPCNKASCSTSTLTSLRIPQRANKTSSKLPYHLQALPVKACGSLKSLISQGWLRQNPVSSSRSTKHTPLQWDSSTHGPMAHRRQGLLSRNCSYTNKLHACTQSW